MDGDWLERRHLDGLRERLEEEGWELGASRRYMDLPPVFAEYGDYRISFSCRDPVSGESFFEVREMCGGMERRVVLVRGVPTPEEAEKLLERYGLGPGDESRPEDRGSWSDILPPVVARPGGTSGRRVRG